MPTSTLTTPIANLILTRTITRQSITIELHDTDGTPLYAEEIALTATAPTEPSDPEQAL